MSHSSPGRRGGVSRRAHPGRRSGGAALLVLLAFGAAACGPSGGPEDAETRLARFDSLLADLGGPQTEALNRGQRWRLLASVGTGLPPASYRLEDLPEPDARAVGLQQAYCLQCHGVSSPRMHTAEEWPILVRRMLMRARTLRDRLGGPLTEEMVDEMLMAGLRTAELPSAEDADSLVAWFTRNALPAAAPGELGEGPDARLYVETCSLCHETPSPYAHGPAGAEALVGRMSALMEMMGLEPPTREERARLVAYLETRQADATERAGTDRPE